MIDAKYTLSTLSKAAGKSYASDDDKDEYIAALEERIDFLEDYAKQADERADYANKKWQESISKLKQIKDIIDEPK